MKLNFAVKQRGKVILNSYKDLLKEDYRVLDVGCGSGQLAKFIEENSNWTITGTDIDDVIDDDVNIPFKLMKENNKLDFEDNSFDIVMFNGVLHHIGTKDRQDLIEEAFKLTKTILIFEATDTIINRLFCYTMCKIRFPFKRVYQNYLSDCCWGGIFLYGRLDYEELEIKKDWYYPLTHIAYKLKEK